MNRLLSDSPWALAIEATMDDPADQPEISTGVPTEISQAGLPANAKQGAAVRWDGGIGKNRRGHLATIPVIVRWDSAAVVRRALARRHDPAVQALDTAAAADFVITVSGLLPAKQLKAPATLHQKSSSDDADTARTTEETLEWFMSNSRLLTKGLPQMQPHNVTLDSDTGAVHIFFKRSEALLSHKREVFFLTRFGSMNVQARFHTKDMVLDGKLDL